MECISSIIYEFRIPTSRGCCNSYSPFLRNSVEQEEEKTGGHIIRSAQYLVLYVKYIIIYHLFSS